MINLNNDYERLGVSALYEGCLEFLKEESSAPSTENSNITDAAFKADFRQLYHKLQQTNVLNDYYEAINNFIEPAVDHYCAQRPTIDRPFVTGLIYVMTAKLIGQLLRENKIYIDDASRPGQMKVAVDNFVKKTCPNPHNRGKVLKNAYQIKCARLHEDGNKCYLVTELLMKAQKSFESSENSAVGLFFLSQNNFGYPLVHATEPAYELQPSFYRIDFFTFVSKFGFDSLRCLEKAADALYPPALYLLAKYHYDKNDYSKALVYLKLIPGYVPSSVSTDETLIVDGQYKDAAAVAKYSNGRESHFIEQLQARDPENYPEKTSQRLNQIYYSNRYDGDLLESTVENLLDNKVKAEGYLVLGCQKYKECPNSTDIERCWKLSSGLSNSQADLFIGLLYAKNISNSAEVLKGIEYLNKARDAGSLDAHEALHKLYCKAAVRIKKPKSTEDLFFLELAADYGSFQAAMILSRFYAVEHPNLSSKDLDKVQKYRTKALENKNIKLVDPRKNTKIVEECLSKDDMSALKISAKTNKEHKALLVELTADKTYSLTNKILKALNFQFSLAVNPLKRYSLAVLGAIGLCGAGIGVVIISLFAGVFLIGAAPLLWGQGFNLSDVGMS